MQDPAPSQRKPSGPSPAASSSTSALTPAAAVSTANGNNAAANVSGGNGEGSAAAAERKAKEVALECLEKMQGHIELAPLLHYLQKYPGPEFQEFLCEELRRFELHEVEFWLPQLCNLMIHQPAPGSLDRYVLELCGKSVHILLRVFFLIRAAVEDAIPATHQRAIQLQNSLSLFIGPDADDHVVSLWVDELCLLRGLTRLSTKLNTLPPEQQTEALRSGLRSLNGALSVGLYLPITRADQPFHCILNIVADDAFCLGTRARTPYMMFLETAHLSGTFATLETALAEFRQEKPLTTPESIHDKPLDASSFQEDSFKGTSVRESTVALLQRKALSSSSPDVPTRETTLQKQEERRQMRERHKRLLYDNQKLLNDLEKHIQERYSALGSSAEDLPNDPALNTSSNAGPSAAQSTSSKSDSSGTRAAETTPTQSGSGPATTSSTPAVVNVQPAEASNSVPITDRENAVVLRQEDRPKVQDDKEKKSAIAALSERLSKIGEEREAIVNKEEKAREILMEELRVLQAMEKVGASAENPLGDNYYIDSVAEFYCEVDRKELKMQTKGPKFMSGEDDWIVLDTSDSDYRHEVMTLAYRELWSDRRKRIQQSSPFGPLPGWELQAVIVKAEDDLRQEQMAMQLIQSFDQIFKERRLPLYLRPYEIIATSSSTGFIEVVPDAVSLDSMKRRFNAPTLSEYFIRTYGARTSRPFKKAVKNFVESLAAYSVVCYLLQIKDRHNGNILLDTQGHIIHIDYGFLLSTSPGNWNFETAPFKLTSEYVELIGGEESDMFRYFQMLFLCGFLEARNHYHRIVQVVELMLPGQKIGCINKTTIPALKERFQMMISQDDCAEFVAGLIRDSLGSWRTVSYDNYQRWTNGIMP